MSKRPPKRLGPISQNNSNLDNWVFLGVFFAVLNLKILKKGREILRPIQ